MKSLRYFKVFTREYMNNHKCLYIKALSATEASFFAAYLWKMDPNKLRIISYGVNKVDPDVKAIFGSYPGKCYINTAAGVFKSMNIVQLATYEVMGAQTRDEKLSSILEDAEAEAATDVPC